MMKGPFNHRMSNMTIKSIINEVINLIISSSDSLLIETTINRFFMMLF